MHVGIMAMVKIFVIATLVAMAGAQVERCNEFIDVLLMVDGSSSVGPSIDSYRNGIRNLVARMNINGATQTSLVQLGICYFGTGEVQAVPLSLSNTQASVRLAVENVAFPGGRTSYHQGIACVDRNFLAASRPGAKQVVVLVVDGNPDRNSRTLADDAVNNLKATGKIVSLIAIADQFVNKNATFRFASAPQLAFSVNDFSEFESSTNQLLQAVCPEEFIPTTTTTTTPAPTIPTTTTTPRPTREQAPCDNCLIINGVGYAKAEDCMHYYQCILQDDETWLEFRRAMPVGAYWDQGRITGNDPVRANCPEDPCRGQTNGTIIGGYENCRARITCFGGISSFIECCPPGTGLGGNGECVANAACNDECNLLDTTAGTCYLSPDVNGDPTRFMANDGPSFSQSMPCSIGTVYNDDICGCMHTELEFAPRVCGDHPEVRLEFGADGSVRDISRNLYTTTSFGLSTVEVSPGVYAGSFNGTSGIRISNSNMGLQDQEFTIRVVYTSRGNIQNAAVVSDAECVNTLRAVSIFDDNRRAQGFVRTLPNRDVSVTSTNAGDRKEVVMQYNGVDLVLNTDGAILSTAAGALLANDAFCDGTHLGYSNDAASFVGDILEFEIFKCIGLGTETFQRSASG